MEANRVSYGCTFRPSFLELEYLDIEILYDRTLDVKKSSVKIDAA